MIKITTQPIYDDFFNMCADAQQNIMLCAPFVKREIVDDIFSVTADRGLSMQLITNINLQSFYRRVSDLDAIEEFLNNGSVYNCTTLHAKLYIFDNKRCIITSANLTTSGLKKNLECSILTDDMDLVDSSVYEYNSIIKDDRVGKIMPQSISAIDKILKKIPPVQIEYPQFDLLGTYESDINSIAKSFTGWKRSVFVKLNSLQEDTFSSQEVKIIAEQLKETYPHNHNREAKIRQILQQLRDIGLIEFTSPGIYKRLWVKGNINEV